MGTAAIGAGVGLALALLELVFLRALSARVDLPETKRVLRLVGVIQLVLFPLLGWFLAPLVFGD